MSNFNDTSGWVLLNDIIERPSQSGRPLKLKARKNRFYGNLVDLQATAAVEWDDGDPKWVFNAEGDDLIPQPGSEQRMAGHTPKHSITGRVNLDECCIHAFTLDNERPVQKFRTIQSFRVIPIDPEKRRDGASSGYLYPCGSIFSYADEGGHLSFEGFLDETAFMELFDRIVANPDKVVDVSIGFSSGLFLDEVDAAFWQPGYTKDLGLLVKSDGSGRAPARIDRLSVRFGPGMGRNGSGLRSFLSAR